jgi:hypothetical protein
LAGSVGHSPLCRGATGTPLETLRLARRAGGVSPRELDLLNDEIVRRLRWAG